MKVLRNFADLSVEDLRRGEEAEEAAEADGEAGGQHAGEQHQHDDDDDDDDYDHDDDDDDVTHYTRVTRPWAGRL